VLMIIAVLLFVVHGIHIVCTVTENHTIIHIHNKILRVLDSKENFSSL
jgi:hypothetical protein